VSGCAGGCRRCCSRWPTVRRRFPTLSDEPLRDFRRRKITLTTTVGYVVLEVLYGQDRPTARWLSPVREHWRLEPHQPMSPVLEQRLCYTPTLSNSYEKAAALPTKWATPSDDSLVHDHAQEAGQRANRLP